MTASKVAQTKWRWG